MSISNSEGAQEQHAISKQLWKITRKNETEDTHLSYFKNQLQLIKCLSVYKVYRKDQEAEFFFFKKYSLIMPFCLIRHNKSSLTKEIRGRRAHAHNVTRSSSYRQTIYCAYHFQIFSNKQPTKSVECKCLEMTHTITHIRTYIHPRKFKYKSMWDWFNDFS